MTQAYAPANWSGPPSPIHHGMAALPPLLLLPAMLVSRGGNTSPCEKGRSDFREAKSGWGSLRPALADPSDPHPGFDVVKAGPPPFRGRGSHQPRAKPATAEAATSAIVVVLLLVLLVLLSFFESRAPRVRPGPENPDTRLRCEKSFLRPTPPSPRTPCRPSTPRRRSRSGPCRRCGNPPSACGTR